MRNLKGFTLIELLIVVAIIAILAAIAVPNFLEAQVRSKVSRVRADHRSLATAIESYYVDNNQYPSAAFDGASDSPASIDQDLVTTSPGRSFAIKIDGDANNAGNTITTPVAYVTTVFGDPFADTRNLPFRYFKDRAGWILGSWGPDTDQSGGGDLVWNESGGTIGDDDDAIIETVYDGRVSQPSQTLLAGESGNGGTAGAYTYDPTNGTVSQGDVWRVRD